MLVPDDTNSITRIGSIAQHEMEVAFDEIFPDAPTVKLVEPKVGRTWGDLESMEVWLSPKTGAVEGSGQSKRQTAGPGRDPGATEDGGMP